MANESCQSEFDKRKSHAPPLDLAAQNNFKSKVEEEQSNSELENSLIKMEEHLNNTQSAGKPNKVHSSIQSRSIISQGKSFNASR